MTDETGPDPDPTPDAEQPGESGTSRGRAQGANADPEDVEQVTRDRLAVAVAAARLRDLHEAARFCDDLDVRYVERDASPDVIVCDGCTDAERGGRFDAPPILWREGEGVVRRERYPTPARRAG